MTTVGELIERLAKYNLDSPVVVASRKKLGWEDVETTLSFLAEKDDEEIAVVSLSTITGEIHDS